MFAFSLGCLFWQPVFFLYFTELVGVAGALRLEAVYYISVVILEIPSGYLSDRYGRTKVLFSAAIFFVMAHLCFFMADGIAVLAIAQVCLAAGFAFISGSDTALHYDALKCAGQEVEYEKREANAAANSFAALAISAAVGGVVGSFWMKGVFLLSAGASVFTAVMAGRMSDPVQCRSIKAPDIFQQIRNIRLRLKNHRLLYLFGFSLLFTVLNHLPYEFYQPYLSVSAGTIFPSAVPALAGIHLCATMAVGAFFSRHSPRMRKRFGRKGVFLISLWLQAGLLVSMAVWVHPIVAVLLMSRSVSRALCMPVLLSGIAPLIERSERATFLSIQSLFGRLAFGAVLLLLSGALSAADPLFSAIITAAVIALICTGVFSMFKLPRA
ncbi:MAG: MFS transporter [Desulfobacteraceae bacterium]|nr:MFS transporter [Desulfobacteraceae bacterium]